VEEPSGRHVLGRQRRITDENEQLSSGNVARGRAMMQNAIISNTVYQGTSSIFKELLC